MQKKLQHFLMNTIVSSLFCHIAFIQPYAHAQINSSPVEMNAYKHVEALYNSNALDEAKSKASDFITHYPASQLIPLIDNIRGLIFLRNKQPNDAIPYFQNALKQLPTEKDEYQRYHHSVLFNLATAYLEAGQLDNAYQTVQQVKPEMLDKSSQNKTNILKSAIEEKRTKLENDKKDQALEKTQTNSVGILLPMTGKFAKYGMKSLQAIQLAFEIFGEGDSIRPKLNLIIEDSGDQTDQTLTALNRLALKHRVVAVIGPMLTKGIDEITKRAETLKIPLLSLSRRSSTFASEYVISAGLTQQMQATEMARHAVESLNLKKFAIIYPDEKLGYELGNSFWDAVESLGGKVVGAEAYTPGQTDFRKTVDKLAGLYYSDARHRELEELTKQRETNNITRRTRKTEQFYSLKPIVDFEAVFVADDPIQEGQILPTFAYRDVDHVRFLGTSSWNSAEFVSRTQSYGENAALVDVYPPGPASNSPMMTRFVENYKTQFGQEPSSLEAIAYDAGRILANLLSHHSESDQFTRADLLKELTSVKNFSGVTGTITFKTGQFFRPMKLIIVKSGQLTEARTSQ